MTACPSAGANASVVTDIIALQRVCNGTIVTQRSQIGQLRFCTYIDGNLTLSVADDDTVDSDYGSVFNCLAEIKGAGAQWLLP